MKIKNENGAEQLIATAGLCSEGTARKIFRKRGNYYQALHALWIHSEAVLRLFWEAFLTWAVEKDTTLWLDSITALVKVLMWNKGHMLNKFDQIKDASLHILSLQRQLEEFQNSHNIQLQYS